MAEPMNMLAALEWAVGYPQGPEDPRVVQARINVTDEENACPHGALPFDTEIACSCWTAARTRALVNDTGGPLCSAPADWPD